MESETTTQLLVDLVRLQSILAFDKTGRTAELERGIGRHLAEFKRRGICPGCELGDASPDLHICPLG
jgi:hypothetical protein